MIIYKDGQLINETTEHEWLNRFLCLNFLGRMIRPLFRSHFVSMIYGRYQGSFLSKWKIKKFIRKYSIPMNDFIVPMGGYLSFNDFFIRKLQSHARPINTDSSVLISPVDGRLLVAENLSEKSLFFVKKKPFSLKKFLQDEELAKEYECGTLLLFRLTASDYHRYHFPCDATPLQPVAINGLLESVNPLVYKAGVMPLQENERHRMVLETKEFGRVTAVAVGAMLVGKITHLYAPNQNARKGEEMGHFSFGGSSLVLLFKPGMITVNERFVQNSSKNIETVVRMGEGIGRKL